MLLPFHTVRVDRSAEAGFRRRALKALPKEHLETLWGFVENGVAHICVFMPIEQKATPTEVSYSDQEIAAQRLEARAYQMEYLGTIHTHPGRDETIFSEGDLRELQRLPEMVMGICAIETKENKRRKCHIAYWPGIKPLKVEYTDWARKDA